MGGSARRRFAWANAQAQGPRLRDPPEIRIHDLAPPGAFGRIPTINEDRCSRGRAHRPGLRGPSRFVPKRRRSHEKLSGETLQQPATEGQRQRQALAGRAARAGAILELKASDGRFSPANHPAQTPKANPEERTESSFCRVCAGKRCAGFYRRLGGRRQKPARKEKTGRRGALSAATAGCPESGAFLRSTWGELSG